MRFKNILMMLSLCAIQLNAGAVVPGDRYLIEENATTSYIYSDEYRPMMAGLKAYDKKVLDALSKEYGYAFDETLYVMLASQNNQITNAFSTQIPFNAQLHYGAGAGGGGLGGHVDWLKTLLVHESAHNFQLNAKENPLSKVSHEIFGASLLTPLGFPFPNYFLGSFLLEGNAVLNESRFGIGGRLYSGAIIAQDVAIARAGKLTPEQVRNNTLEYPYRSRFYHIGGLFQAYLAEHYGAKKVNGFYKAHSRHNLPFMINNSFKAYFGEDLETLIASFRKDFLLKHTGFQKSQGKKIAHAEAASRMQRNGDKVDIMLRGYRSTPIHLQIDRNGQASKQEKTTYPLGDMFMLEGKHYTQSTQFVSPKRIVKGLYNEDAKLLKNTDSKIVQGVMPDGKLVYINVNDSYERWHLYVGNKFYAVVSSDVLVMPSGDIYYFKQKGKMRVAYKNHAKLFSYEGYYGNPSDVDSRGRLYFIAPSKDGSGLYRQGSTGIERIGKSDDIIDMKLLGANTMLIAAMGAKGITYLKQDIQTSPAKIAQIKYKFKNIVENDNQINSFIDLQHKVNTSSQAEAYHAIEQLHYSLFAPYLGYSAEDGLIAGGIFQWTDPMQFNSLTVPFHSEDDYSMLGFLYGNSASLLNYRIGIFGVFDANSSLGYRDYGVSASLSYPLLKEGYEKANITLRYDQPYDKLTQKPLSAIFHWDDTKQYGYSMYPNASQSIDISLSSDRGTNSFGLGYTFWHDFGNENYMSFSASYFKSNEYNASEERGITVARRQSDYAYNPASIEIYGLQNDLFVDEALKGEVGLYKVFNVSKYFFSFPLSLQRESLYAKARYYALGHDRKRDSFAEYVLGTQIDLLVYHELNVPLSVEWIHNDDVYEKDSIRFGLEFSF